MVFAIFGFDSSIPIVNLLLIFTVAMIVLLIGTLIYNIAQEQRIEVILARSNGRRPELTLREGQKYHLLYPRCGSNRSHLHVHSLDRCFRKMSVWTVIRIFGAQGRYFCRLSRFVAVCSASCYLVRIARFVSAGCGGHNQTAVAAHPPRNKGLPG